MPKKLITTIDEELAQSKARFIICIIFSFIVIIASIKKGFIPEEFLTERTVIVVLCLLFSGPWYLLVRHFPNKHPWRRNISLLADLGITSFFLQVGGQQAAWGYAIFLWIIIGNGIRFGEKMMIRGIVLGTISFGCVVYSNSYWRANLGIGLGLLASVIILPIFFLGVLRRLQAMHELRVELTRSKLAEKAKDQFLAAMSHELRTPMNGVLGMAETLSATDLKTEQKEHLKMITRSVESLLNIINDVLDYSKISTGKLYLKTTQLDLKQILEDVVQLMETTACKKGIGLNLTFPENSQRFFIGDPTRIRQIVFNLVGNAIKFTEKGSVNLVYRTSQKPFSSTIILEISDTGIGIPRDRLSSIFGHFEQVDNSTTRQYDGTGLGLAISQQLAEMMGGSIEVESTLGEGSRFTVQLELKPGVAPQPKAISTEKTLPDFGLKALVVEDNKFNQVVITNILKRIGVTSNIAENGAQSLEMLDTDHYDVVFMDVRIPIMNGYDATRAIRNRTDCLSGIPIFALTGEATKADVKKCIDSGMNLHMAKPISLEKIINVLSGLSELVKHPA